MKEIRWQSGKDEYTREEIEYMLESQRAMIHNDLNYILVRYARDYIGIKGGLSSEGKVVMNYLKNPNTVEI